MYILMCGACGPAAYLTVLGLGVRAGNGLHGAATGRGSIRSVPPCRGEQTGFLCRGPREAGLFPFALCGDIGRGDFKGGGFLRAPNIIPVGGLQLFPVLGYLPCQIALQLLSSGNIAGQGIRIVRLGKQ